MRPNPEVDGPYPGFSRPETPRYGQPDRDVRIGQPDEVTVSGQLWTQGRDEAARRRAERGAARRSRFSAWMRHVALLVPLVLVNGVAIWGQAAWAFEHLAHNLVIAIGFAAALETIGIYLAVEAHAALMNDDSAFKLRAGSYLVAGLAGALNYAHFADPGYRPTPIALAFGVLSTLSPWLWSIRSRSMHRADLAARGLVDKRAVKFPAIQWLLYPIRTFRAFRVGVWAGINHPTQARSFLLERDALHHMGEVEAVRYAYGALGIADPHTARVWLAVRGVRVSQADIDQATGGRPVSAPPAPVSGAPSEATEPTDRTQRDRHAARLEALPTKRDKIRYAFAAVGSYDVTAAREWLARFGVDVSRSEAHQVARHATGEFTMVAVPAAA